MAKVDYKALGMDTKLGRQYRDCAKCKEESAVTVLCPLREKSRNPYVCVYCCWKCGYSRQTAQGHYCSILANRKRREKEEQRAVREAKRAKRGVQNDTADNGVYTVLLDDFV